MYLRPEHLHTLIQSSDNKFKIRIFSLVTREMYQYSDSMIINVYIAGRYPLPTLHLVSTVNQLLAAAVNNHTENYLELMVSENNLHVLLHKPSLYILYITNETFTMHSVTFFESQQLTMLSQAIK